MRAPLPVLWFSWLWLGSLFASIATVIATWDDLVADLPVGEAREIGGYAVGGLYAFTVGISLLLWWRIMRRRSRGARTILTLLSVVGAFLVAVAVVAPFLELEIEADMRPDGWQFLENASVVVGLVANALLFAPGARHWFDDEPDLSGVFS